MTLRPYIAEPAAWTGKAEKEHVQCRRFRKGYSVPMSVLGSEQRTHKEPLSPPWLPSLATGITGDRADEQWAWSLRVSFVLPMRRASDGNMHVALRKCDGTLKHGRLLFLSWLTACEQGRA